ncbi:MAG: hypothetical protein P1P88_05170 [Bacteroidales bacterium]|nr:hypothetical protein [Bacteroidales bacterium]
MRTVLVELRNDNALRLLKDLELINIIRVLDTHVPEIKEMKKERKKLSASLRGSISKDRAKELNDQLDQMRSEWEIRDI